ncbi:MAG: cell surface protein, partial [Clostridia bacterium]|nr:cell surface protein [Clostridia bacterium]
MPFINRYSDVKKGGIAFIGNTLGLSKATNLNAPGTQGSIGAFTSLDTSLQVGLFPAGTTLDYTKNGSNAILTLPAGSSVLYAELVWGGLYRSSANNISSLINNSVTFTTPSGAHTVAPDATTSQTFTIPAGNVTVGFYVRSAEVTSFVQTGGTYSVQGVPALIEAIDDRTADTNHAGWTLAVVYEDPTATLRNLTLWCGGTVVSPESGSTTITVTDFITPEVLPVSGKIFVSAQEGDAVLEGDQMLFGPNTSSLVALSGSNNPEDNFFASQINNANGVLVTTGTFGTRNANAATGTNTVACRQGWDITAVDVSNQLAVNQTSAAIRFTSDGDLYVPNALALQVDSKGADLQVTKSADKTYA